MPKQKQLHRLKVLNTGRETLICYLKINFLWMPVALFVGEWPVNKPRKLQDKGEVNFIFNIEQTPPITR